MQIVLTRDVYAPDYTHGTINLSTKLHTIEQPWANNHCAHSCVPDGLYDLVPYYSPKHSAWTFCLHNAALGIFALPDMIPETAVNGRSVCEIHSANFADQLLGCIAPGLAWGTMQENGEEKPAVLSSKAAVAFLMKTLVPDGDVKNAHGHTLLIQAEAGQPGTSGYTWMT